MFPIIGILLLSLGGFAAGSFYMPYKLVKKWAWEVFWLYGGLFSWIIMPITVVLITVPGIGDLVSGLSLMWGSVFLIFIFGVLWGIGSLMYGLGIRYMGMSLGNALALGYCALFGTILPPVYKGTITKIASTTGGQITLLGVLIGIAGIAIIGWSGMLKDNEMDEETKKKTVAEFNFKKGLIVTFVAGLMSACFAFGIEAGKPLAWLTDQIIMGNSIESITSSYSSFDAVSYQYKSMWVNNPVFIFVMFGGFVTNLIWCSRLYAKNKTGKDFFDKSKPLARNYLFAALGGTIWYFQFMFYGMGDTQMGEYSFASWSLLMTFIIFFSNMWGLILGEWKGVRPKTRIVIFSGLIVLVLSAAVIGYANYIGG